MGVAFRNIIVGQLTKYHDMKMGARGHTVILLSSRSVMSNSLQPCGLQHARLPCPLPSPRVCSNSCPLSWWCHPTILSCHPLLLLPSVFPSIRVFPNVVMYDPNILCYVACFVMLFTSGGHSIGASASVLPMNIQGWFPLGLTGMNFFLSKGLSRVFSSTTVWRHQFFGAQPFLLSNSHIHTWLLEKPQLWLHRLCRQSNVSTFQYSV